MYLTELEIGAHLRCPINTRHISSLVITIERFFGKLFKSLQRCSFTSFDYLNTSRHNKIWKGTVLIRRNWCAYLLWCLCRCAPTMYTPGTIERCVDAIWGVITWFTYATGCNRIWTTGTNEFNSCSLNSCITSRTVTFIFI